MSSNKRGQGASDLERDPETWFVRAAEQSAELAAVLADGSTWLASLAEFRAAFGLGPGRQLSENEVEAVLSALGLHQLVAVAADASGNPAGDLADISRAARVVVVSWHLVARDHRLAPDGNGAVGTATPPKVCTVGGKRFIEMSALLVQRPWCDRIFAETLWGNRWPRSVPRKSIEVRGYDEDYRGPLLVVASKSPSPGWRDEDHGHALAPLMEDRSFQYHSVGVVELTDVRPYHYRLDDGAAGFSMDLQSLLGTRAQFAWCVTPRGLVDRIEFPEICTGCLALKPGTDGYKRHQQSQHVKVQRVRMPWSAALATLAGLRR